MALIEFQSLRKIKMIVAGLQMLSAVILVLFTICVFSRHSFVQVIQMNGRESKAQNNNRPIVTADFDDYDALNYTLTSTEDSEPTKGDDDTSSSTYSHTVGQLLIICSGIMFISLIVMGIYVDIVIPPPKPNTDEEKQADEQDKPKPTESSNGDGGIPNPAYAPPVVVDRTQYQVMEEEIEDGEMERIQETKDL